MHPLKRTFRKKHELPISNKTHSVHTSHQILNPKQLSLITLVIQNSMLVLLMRYSRTKSSDEPIYIASTAVFMAEVVKIVVSKNNCLDMLYLQIIRKPQEVAKMLIPSGLYALQNNLLYIALSNLEAATFQVTYQLKVLSTAAFSIWLLNRTLNQNQWIALVLLMIGVTLVQSESMTGSVCLDDQQPLIGLLSVLASCVSSGFAGCYFEKILKTSTTSMWIRNIQLGICGVTFSLLGMLLSDFRFIRTHGLFYGYNALTWLVVTNQALGGLVVSLVVKYADNILKGFATSISIVLSGLITFVSVFNRHSHCHCSDCTLWKITLYIEKFIPYCGTNWPNWSCTVEPISWKHFDKASIQVVLEEFIGG
ncbi:nucleotide-sugar transporter-domain-containing protein [Gilbertella persicaria]|uniref:nucleotide-sugar transporter-domain-containing protein n=1 Tax=Gilbertella persicaria TaxID=101096 RepID=UPI00221FB592|nr:nucleotide-sugar transporter-domain-containing protein [Gilbertella persicaria]KAI8084249.1 nucleotide-sugar transporter-domain-containing protein [Gilbertella persicaria]